MATTEAVAVVGAGIIGSWTAYQLLREGRSVVLIEQFALPHSRGSSHGQSRAFRYSGERDLNIIKAAEKEWLALEAAVKEQLLVRAGRLAIGPVGDANLTQVAADLDKHGIPHEWLSPAELSDRFSMIHFPGCQALYEPGSGVLLAHKAVSCLHAEIRRLGGRILIDTVLNIEASADSVIVTTRNAGFMRFDSAAICTGAWTKRLLPDLPLHTRSVAVCYWKEKDIGTHAIKNGFPNFYSKFNDNYFYGIPSCEYDGLVKILHHGGPVVSPELRDQADHSVTIAQLAAFVSTHFARVEGSRPALVERCMYTCTPDDVPVVDFHPKTRRIVVGAAFCGEGFKSSAAYGKILTDMLLGRSVQFDMKPLEIARFVGGSKL